MEAATVRKRTEPRIGSAPLKITSAVVGQTPWSARDPLVPLFELSSDSHRADEGVGLQTRGSAPHSIFILIDGRQGHGALPHGRGSVKTREATTSQSSTNTSPCAERYARRRWPASSAYSRSDRSRPRLRTSGPP